MARKTTKSADDEVMYRYHYTGADAVVLPDLTGHGIGTIEPGASVEAPVVVVHHDFVPADDETELATACRVAEMYPELVTHEVDTGPSEGLPVMPAESSDETDAGDPGATKE